MLDRKTPPPFVQSTSFELIKPVRRTFANGIEMFFVSGGKQEVIKVEVVMRAGRWFENNVGAAQFAANLINKGTEKKTSFQIAETFDRYGAHLEVQPGLDFVTISIYSLTQYLEPVLDLLLELLTSATYPEKELDQHKSVAIQNLKVNLEKTSYVASQIFRKKIFGGDHPYGTEVDENAISQVTREALVSHSGRYFKDLSVFVSGKISSTAEKLLTGHFENFQTIPVTADHTRSVNSTLFREIVDKPGAVQSSIRMGRKGALRGDPDYPYIIFTGHILGGYFGSRLMKNIREEKGLTYGIYSSLHPMQHDSYVVIGADVNKENVDLTIDEIQKELTRLGSEPITTDELSTAKNHFIGSLQAEITTPFAHADKIKTIHLSHLPQDYYQKIIATIAAISPEDILKTGRKYFDPSTYSVVAVG